MKDQRRRRKTRIEGKKERGIAERREEEKRRGEERTKA